MTTTISERAKTASKIVRDDLGDFIRTRGGSVADELEDGQPVAFGRTAG